MKKNITQLFSCLHLTEEEMSCLATWKEGNRKYLVAMMNHSHVYNDESRYRCFIYQKQRGNRGGHLADGSEVSHRSGNKNHSGGSNVRIKMAMSAQASCLGLWNVHEGYKTFELKKRKCFYFYQTQIMLSIPTIITIL